MSQETCEHCNDTGEVALDEYENGQLVGVGTLTQKCICQTNVDDYEED